MTAAVSMSELLQRWSELAVADVRVGATLTRAARESGSLLRPPATEEQVREVEARLGRSLPPSYREFLLLSDGAFGDHWGPTWTWAQNGWEAPTSQSSVVGVGFLPCDDLRWLRDVSPAIAEIWADTETDADDESRVLVVHDGQEPWPWTPMAAGLVIATEKGPGTTCLVPVEGVEEWQVWFIAKETAVAYLSFRSFLERMVAELEPVTSVVELREVIALARAHDPVATERLSRVTTPDAVPLLAQLLEGSLAYRASESLGRIGSAEAVDALVRCPPFPGALDALALVGNERARDHLVESGAIRQLSWLGDPRAAQLAARVIEERDRTAAHHFHARPALLEAIGALGRSRDQRYVGVLLPLCVEETESQTVLSTALALVGLGAPEGRARLAELAASTDPIADRAAWLLGRVDDGYVP